MAGSRSAASNQSWSPVTRNSTACSVSSINVPTSVPPGVVSGSVNQPRGRARSTLDPGGQPGPVCLLVTLVLVTASCRIGRTRSTFGPHRRHHHRRAPAMRPVRVATYLVPRPLPPAAPGRLVAVSATGADRSVDAGQRWVFLYHSTDIAGHDVAVSGQLVVPHGPPAGRRLAGGVVGPRHQRHRRSLHAVASTTSGTVRTPRRCAPSWTPATPWSPPTTRARHPRDPQLPGRGGRGRRGGGRGPRRPPRRRRACRPPGSRWVTPRAVRPCCSPPAPAARAPDLHLGATVALAPASALNAILPAVTALGDLSDQAYAVFALIGLAPFDPTVRAPPALLGPGGRAAAGGGRSTRMHRPGRCRLPAGAHRGPVRTCRPPGWARSTTSWPAPPTRTRPPPWDPSLILQGTTDTDVPAGATAALVAHLGQLGSPVTEKTYAGLDHDGLVGPSECDAARPGWPPTAGVRSVAARRTRPIALKATRPRPSPCRRAPGAPSCDDGPVPLPRPPGDRTRRRRHRLPCADPGRLRAAGRLDRTGRTWPQWWTEPVGPAAIEADYGPCVDGTDPTRAFLIVAGERPVGFIQCYRLARRARRTPGRRAATTAVGVDLFVGEAEVMGGGFGSAVLRPLRRPGGVADLSGRGPWPWPARASATAAPSGPSRRPASVRGRVAVVPGEDDPEQVMVRSTARRRRERRRAHGSAPAPAAPVAVVAVMAVLAVLAADARRAARLRLGGLGRRTTPVRPTGLTRRRPAPARWASTMPTPRSRGWSTIPGPGRCSAATGSWCPRSGRTGVGQRAGPLG